MFTNRFAISDKCVNTWNELMGFRKTERGTLPKEDDHTIDCLRCTMKFAGYNTVFRMQDKVKKFKAKLWISPADDYREEVSFYG